MRCVRFLPLFRVNVDMVLELSFTASVVRSLYSCQNWNLRHGWEGLFFLFPPGHPPIQGSEGNASIAEIGLLLPSPFCFCSICFSSPDPSVVMISFFLSFFKSIYRIRRAYMPWVTAVCYWGVITSSLSSSSHQEGIPNNGIRPASIGIVGSDPLLEALRNTRNMYSSWDSFCPSV